MSGPVVPLPTAKGLAQAQSWLDRRRVINQESQTRRQAFMEGLEDSLSESLGNLGIQRVIVGDQVLVDLAGPPTPVPDQTRKWSDHLAQGGMLTILSVSSAGCGFFDNEKVNPNDRSLEELVDVALIRSLAPTSTLYGPQDVVPWEDYFRKFGFQLWITAPAELNALWRAIPQWVKLGWHDQTMAKSKFFHKAKDVFRINMTRVVAPDLPWRIAQARKAEQESQASEDMGAWDSAAQTSLKNAVSALVVMEGHPLLGEHATRTIGELLPLLAYAMEGKARDKKRDKATRTAVCRVYEGLRRAQVNYKDWSANNMPA